jgi:hypothetical protein
VIHPGGRAVIATSQAVGSIGGSRDSREVRDARSQERSRPMRRVRKLILSGMLVVGAIGATAVPALASNVCPVVGGPNDPSIHGTPAVVPDKSGNPAHGASPSDPQPGDAFWN